QFLVRGAGQHHARHGRRLLAHGGDRPEPLAVGEGQIEQDGFHASLGQALDPFGEPAAGLQVEADERVFRRRLRRQHLLDKVRGVAVVLEEEDPKGTVRLRGGRRGRAVTLLFVSGRRFPRRSRGRFGSAERLSWPGGDGFLAGTCPVCLVDFMPIDGGLQTIARGAVGGRGRVPAAGGGTGPGGRCRSRVSRQERARPPLISLTGPPAGTILAQTSSRWAYRRSK